MMIQARIIVLQQTKRQAPHETQQPQLQPAQPAQALQALQPLAQPLQPLQPLQPRWAICMPSRGVLAVSLSKTKNVPKLTSKSSSSVKAICGPCAVSGDCTSGVCPRVPVADAPPASAIDTPTTPATGTAFFRGLCFVLGISAPMPSGKGHPAPTASLVRLPWRPCKTTAHADAHSRNCSARPPAMQSLAR